MPWASGTKQVDGDGLLLETDGLEDVQYLAGAIRLGPLFSGNL